MQRYWTILCWVYGCAIAAFGALWWWSLADIHARLPVLMGAQAGVLLLRVVVMRGRQWHDEP
jgi:hypothetical protein